MRIPACVTLAVTAALLSIGCNNGSATQPSQPMSASSDSTTRGLTVAGPKSIQRDISMMDACDGPTFNAVIGPGTCGRPQGVSFSDFVALLTAHQSAGPWHFAPSNTDGFLGDTLLATNKGGEEHTFTRVAAFGGGVVPFLNALAGTPNEVPECQAETNFVAPGGTDTDVLDKVGVLKFQCCIHPWMRTTVLVKSH